jgi:hypothetical protein
MPVTRTTLLSGPAAATYKGHTFFAYEGILVSPALEIEAVDSDAQGVLDGTVSGSPLMIKFTPSAALEDLLALYPWTMGSPGVSLFGAADAPLVLVAANGVRLTFSAAAVVAMPDLMLTNRGVVAGAVTFAALGARSLPVSAANRLVTVDSGTFPTVPVGTPRLADDFAVTWGGAPWVSLRARDGVGIRFALKTRAVRSDANALLDLTVEELAVEARFVPATAGGPGETDVMSALGLEGGLPGRSLAATGCGLDVAGEHLFVRLPLAQLTRGELVYDAVHGRVGELVFTAERAFVGTSAAEALATLTGGVPLD